MASDPQTTASDDLLHAVLERCLPCLDALAAEGITIGRDDDDQEHDPLLILGGMAAVLGCEGIPEMFRRYCNAYDPMCVGDADAR